ncbi:alpha/beta fold hydrolase [Piscinibacter sakaiensis]|uniref:alpha/beta fold hydrolase n=1 Tax=Piscinibacter sakaiensis TaxID=1547922 RepID=UPI003AB03FD3
MSAEPQASAAAPYLERRRARSIFLELRGLRLHLLVWGDAALASEARPSLLMLHGWMDVGASFQFVVDAFATDRHIVALDWRGFGQSDRSGADSYWFPDYLGDLDAIVDSLSARGELSPAIDLLGHSMGGNVAMFYAGIRPQRIRRLINLEGFGLPATEPGQAPGRYAKWLDELKQPPGLRRYDSLDAVAERLRKTNPRLPPQRAAWLAGHWARQAADGLWDILGDPAHRRVNPVLYRRDEALACWAAISAPLLWVEGALTDMKRFWGERYPRSDFESRLAVVPQVEREVIADAGHMLHHDQPRALAERIERFIG